MKPWMLDHGISMGLRGNLVNLRVKISFLVEEIKRIWEMIQFYRISRKMIDMNSDVLISASIDYIMTKMMMVVFTVVYEYHYLME